MKSSRAEVVRNNEPLPKPSVLPSSATIPCFGFMPGRVSPLAAAGPRVFESMSYQFSKTVSCRTCKAPALINLHQQIFANGSVNYVWVCVVCGCKNPEGSNQMYIPREKVLLKLTPAQIEDLPVICRPPNARCVVCGNRNCELHHWAPRGIFGDDCEKWPQDYLCPGCHRVWHQRVTPQLVGEGF